MPILTPEDVANLPHPNRGPRRQGLWIETQSAVQPLRLGLATRRLAAAPKGSGRPVMDIPGWRTGEASMAPLRTYLRRRGHHAVGWGGGVNSGDLPRDVPLTVEAVRALADRTGDRVALVGWSLGGVIAREVARTVPDLVRRVITMGSPIAGPPAYTVFSGRMAEATMQQLLDRQRSREEERPLTMPVTTIFTRKDRIVAWPACVDRHTKGVEHVEVDSTHFSLGIDPDVWLVVAERLVADD